MYTNCIHYFFFSAMENTEHKNNNLKGGPIDERKTSNNHSAHLTYAIN